MAKTKHRNRRHRSRKFKGGDLTQTFNNTYDSAASAVKTGYDTTATALQSGYNTTANAIDSGMNAVSSTTTSSTSNVSSSSWNPLNWFKKKDTTYSSTVGGRRKRSRRGGNVVKPYSSQNNSMPVHGYKTAKALTWVGGKRRSRKARRSRKY
jgi:hypothetical protein